jgi:hypothetical protein
VLLLEELSAGKVGQEKGEGSRSGFLLHATTGIAPPGQAPEVLIGVPICEPYGKISRGAYSGK